MRTSARLARVRRAQETAQRNTRSCEQLTRHGVRPSVIRFDDDVSLHGPGGREIAPGHGQEHCQQLRILLRCIAYHREPTCRVVSWARRLPRCSAAGESTTRQAAAQATRRALYQCASAIGCGLGEQAQQ